MSGPTFIPYLAVAQANEALAFYTDVMGMTERLRLSMQDGSLAHAELEFGTGVLYLASEYPDLGVTAPTGAGTSVSLTLEVRDIDGLVARMEAAGSKVESGPRDEFHGSRGAKVIDPFGHRWLLNERKEEVSPEEIKRRFEEMMGG